MTHVTVIPFCVVLETKQKKNDTSDVSDGKTELRERYNIIGYTITIRGIQKEKSVTSVTTSQAI